MRIRISAILLLLLLNACHYQAGYPVAQCPLKTIYVQPIIKDALVANISGVLTRQLREELARNTILKVVTKESGADARLETHLVRYEPTVSSVSTDDALSAHTLSLKATARCSLQDMNTGYYYFKDREFTVEVAIRCSAEGQTAEYQAIPLVARDLAKKIIVAIGMQKGLKEYP